MTLLARMRTMLIACLVLICWHPKCCACKPIEIKVDHVDPAPPWEAFKDSKETTQTADRSETSSRPIGVSSAHEHPPPKERLQQAGLSESFSKDPQSQTPEVKSNSFQFQTVENHPIGPHPLGPPHQTDETSGTHTKASQVPPETKNGAKKAEDNAGGTDSQSKENPTAPGMSSNGPEKFTSGATKPWHRRIWEGVAHWFRTSPSLAARTARFFARWLSFNKAKPKTAEEQKKEKDQEELEKYIKLAHKAREVDPTLVIKQETDMIPKDNHEIVKDSDTISKETKEIERETKRIEKPSDRIPKEQNGIAMKNDGIEKEQSGVSQEEVEELRKFRRMFYQVILDLTNQLELKGTNKIEDQESQTIVHLLKKLNPPPASAHETKAQ